MDCMLCGLLIRYSTGRACSVPQLLILNLLILIGYAGVICSKIILSKVPDWNNCYRFECDLRVSPYQPSRSTLQSITMDDSERKERIWFRDVKWFKKQDDSDDKAIELILSDQRRITIRVDTVEDLQDLISKLENSL